MGTRAVDVELKEAIDLFARVNATDLTALTGGQLEELALLSHEVLNLATAAHTRALAALDVSREWEVDGARSAAVWLAWKGHVPTGRARALVRCGRELRDLPVTEAAFLAGKLTVDHVRMLAGARTVNPETFRGYEAELVEMACDLIYAQFVVAVKYWCHLNDPDTEHSARKRYEQRRAHCSRTFEGTVQLDATFDPVNGAIFAQELARLENRLFEADWSEATERCGGRPSNRDLDRTPAQRRHDALVLMAKRSAALSDGAAVPRPLVTVLVGAATLANICELSDGTVVTPGEVLPLLCDVDLERVVFDTPSRVIDVGARQRYFTGATRRAVEVRDRQCSHPSCTVSSDRCDIDHVIPFDGTNTVQANGDCKCRYHHRFKHRRTQPAP